MISMINKLILILYLSLPLASSLMGWGYVPRIHMFFLFVPLVLVIATARLSFFVCDNKIKTGRFLMLTVFLLLLITVVILISYFDSGVQSCNLYLNSLNKNILMSWVAVFAGCSLAKIINQEKFFLVVVWLSYLAVLIYGSFLGYQTTGKVYFLFQWYSQQGAKLFNINMHVYADNFAIISLLFLCKLHKCRDRSINEFVVFVISCTALFFALSRTSLYLFVILSISLFLAKRKKIKHKFFVIACLLGCSCLLSYNIFGDSGLFGIVTNKMLSVTKNSSFEVRMSLLSEVPFLLKQYWMFGRYLVEISDGHGSGRYIHNWISFWLAYGIVPFVMSISLLFGVLAKAIAKKYSDVIVLSVFCLLAILLTRAYNWDSFWFLLAFSARKVDSAVILPQNRGTQRYIFS